ncbi:hypothetical protein RJ639_018581 [Escallonia herrerae]|uniref:Uncharacterized protein n=1 Tax=Escallonia herrerae TaxID=1293975 RepID=A0AA88VBZ0_9ASTE|nr:hypothetical protein RJ639_018581 [Escallonia herrerae]
MGEWLVHVRGLCGDERVGEWTMKGLLIGLVGEINAYVFVYTTINGHRCVRMVMVRQKGHRFGHKGHAGAFGSWVVALPFLLPRVMDIQTLPSGENVPENGVLRQSYRSFVLGNVLRHLLAMKRSLGMSGLATFSEDELVATPGRLVDQLLNTKGFTLRTLKYLVLFHDYAKKNMVLDLADRLLNEDFEKIIDQVLSVIPRDRKMYPFSAAMAKKVLHMHAVLTLERLDKAPNRSNSSQKSYNQANPAQNL